MFNELHPFGLCEGKKARPPAFLENAVPSRMLKSLDCPELKGAERGLLAARRLSASTWHKSSSAGGISDCGKKCSLLSPEDRLSSLSALWQIDVGMRLREQTKRGLVDPHGMPVKNTLRGGNVT